MYSDSALAFWITSPGQGEIRAEQLAPLQPNEIQVQTLWSGVSRGTEALVFQGRVPESEHGRMRAPFQAGEFPGPVKYGYASVGRVVRGPPQLEAQSVFCLYPHQTRYSVPASAVYRIPDGVPPGRAVLAANLETAVNGLWDAAPHVGDRVSVVGGGTVGCLVAWLAARIPGCEVELIDLNPRRAAVAQALGVRFAAPSAARTQADVVIHTSGSPQGLQLALQLAAFETRVVEMSWYGNQPVSLALGETFHAQRLQLISSQVGTVAAPQRARWTTQRRMEFALALLADPALDILINSESRFDELPTVMARLAAAPGDVLMHRVSYHSQTT
jgi:2-desacetyl-2-hydroxyethyl bacteriochlorophyllide A dehydrogenase